MIRHISRILHNFPPTSSFYFLHRFSISIFSIKHFPFILAIACSPIFFLFYFSLITTQLLLLLLVFSWNRLRQFIFCWGYFGYFFPYFFFFSLLILTFFSPPPSLVSQPTNNNNYVSISLSPPARSKKNILTRKWREHKTTVCHDVVVVIVCICVCNTEQYFS